MINHKHTLWIFNLSLLVMLATLASCSAPAVSTEEAPAPASGSGRTDAEGVEVNTEAQQNPVEESSDQPQEAPSVGVESDAEPQAEVDIHCTETDPHPIGESIAETFDVTYEQVMTWFCSGSTFDDILIALETSQEVDASVDQLLAMRAESSWEVIWDEFGLAQNQ